MYNFLYFINLFQLFHIVLVISRRNRSRRNETNSQNVGPLWWNAAEGINPGTYDIHGSNKCIHGVLLGIHSDVTETHNR